MAGGAAVGALGRIAGLTGRAAELTALGGSALFAAGQSTGGTYAEAYAANLERYEGDAAQARAESIKPALVSGLITGLVTFGGGTKGVESLFRSEAGRAVVRRTLLESMKAGVVRFAREGGSELLEEAVDTLGQVVLAKLTFDPDKTFEQAVAEVVESGLLGFVLGVGMGAAHGGGKITPEPDHQASAGAISGAASVAELSDAELYQYVPPTLPDGSADPAKTMLRDRAEALRAVTEGKPLADLSDKQLASLGYQRDAQNPDNVVPVQGVGAPPPVVTFEKDGKPVIRPEAIEELRAEFPETAALVSGSEEMGKGGASVTDTGEGATAAGDPALGVQHGQAIEGPKEAFANAESIQEASPVNEASYQRPAKTATSESVATPNIRAIADKGAAERSQKSPGYVSYAYSLKKRSTKSESDHAALDADLSPAQRFEHVSDIGDHAPARVRRLIESETMKFDGSSQESFRTTVSKAIGRELANDRNFLKRFDWGKYLESHIGPVPLIDGKKMYAPHGHHFVYKQWLETQDPLVREAHDLLWGAGIDPIFGLENLGWAPMTVTGQHTTANLKEMVGQLKDLKQRGRGYKHFVELLNDFGDIAASRK